MAKETFNYKNIFELRNIPLEEICSYYRKLRSYEYDNNKSLESSSFKKRIHLLTMLILKIDRLTTGRKLVIFDDKRNNNTEKGKVYAASHVGRYDIESALEAIKEQAYFIMGDPEETYRNFEGFFLDKLQGRICMDTGYNIYDLFQKKKLGNKLTKEELEIYNEYKKDRHVCEDTCTKRIANKDNILIYPEAAWNITPRLTQTLFPGAARIAVNGNGVINPIGIIKEGKTYIVNIGSELDVSGAELSDVKDITNELKELLNTLKGEIIFSNIDNISSRETLGTFSEIEKSFIEEIMAETTNGYTVDVIEKTRYYDPDYPENVFKGYTYQKK